MLGPTYLILYLALMWWVTQLAEDCQDVIVETDINLVIVT